MSEADVADSFRNVRVDSDRAHNVYYTARDQVGIEFRIAFGWSGTLGFRRFVFVAAECAQCNTGPNSTQSLRDVKYRIAHVNTVY